MLAPNETVQHLQAARNLIADPAKWCRYGFDRGGAHCAIGADLFVKGLLVKNMEFTTDDVVIYEMISPELWRAAADLFPKEIEGRRFKHPAAAVWWVNDYLGHEAVLRMYQRAIELAATGEP